MPDLFPQGAILIESKQSLDDDISEEVRLGALPRNEAMELLATKADLARADERGLLLDSICALLADVPLAIVITARTIRENSLSLMRAHQILNSIKPVSTEAGQIGIERAFALAHSTLTDLERQWLAAAALAPGISIDPQFLHQMAGDEALAEHTQKRLQAMGLLTANNPRLRIDPGIRALARSGADEISLREQFLNFLENMLRKHSLDWEYCTDELGNILGMISWAAGQRRWSDVIALGRAIDPYLILHGLWDAWHEVIENVLQSARQLGNRAEAAWSFHQLGSHAIGIGSNGQAVDFLQQALSLRGQLGDTVGMAYTQHNLDLLIPPPPPSNNNRQPPDRPTGKPSISNKAFNLVLKTLVIGTAMAVSGYFAVNALYSRILPSSSVPASELILPVTGSTARSPTATRISLATETRTMTPTNIPTKTPTQTPTNSPTMSFTPSPTSEPSNMGNPQLSTNAIYYRGTSCDPNRITIRVAAKHPAGIKVVVFFHRMHEIDTGRDSGWSEGFSMNTPGGGVYALSVNGDSLIGNSGFTTQVSVSYQFVIQTQNGELLRSKVYQDLSLLPCGSSRPPRPPITISPTVTIAPPPITITPRIIIK